LGFGVGAFLARILNPLDQLGVDQTFACQAVGRATVDLAVGIVREGDESPVVRTLGRVAHDLDLLVCQILGRDGRADDLVRVGDVRRLDQVDLVIECLQRQLIVLDDQLSGLLGLFGLGVDDLPGTRLPRHIHVVRKVIVVDRDLLDLD